MTNKEQYLFDNEVYAIDYEKHTAIVGSKGLKVIGGIIEETGDDKGLWTVTYRPNYEFEELVNFMWENRGRVLKGL